MTSRPPQPPESTPLTEAAIAFEPLVDDAGYANLRAIRKFIEHARDLERANAGLRLEMTGEAILRSKAEQKTAMILHERDFERRRAEKAEQQLAEAQAGERLARQANIELRDGIAVVDKYVESLRSQLAELTAAAGFVVSFDWPDNDEDAVAAVSRLASVLERPTAAGKEPE